MLRLSTIGAVTNFSWGPVLQELKVQAPTLSSFIRSALSKRGCKVRRYAVGMSASLLLKSRNKHLALGQAVISVAMYAGHCSKHVSPPFGIFAKGLLYRFPYTCAGLPSPEQGWYLPQSL